MVYLRWLHFVLSVEAEVTGNPRDAAEGGGIEVPCIFIVSRCLNGLIHGEEGWVIYGVLRYKLIYKRSCLYIKCIN